MVGSRPFETGGTFGLVVPSPDVGRDELSSLSPLLDCAGLVPSGLAAFAPERDWSRCAPSGPSPVGPSLSCSTGDLTPSVGWVPSGSLEPSGASVAGIEGLGECTAGAGVSPRLIVRLIPAMSPRTTRQAAAPSPRKSMWKALIWRNNVSPL